MCAVFHFMNNEKKHCAHVLANGQICQGIPMRDSHYCYWHHKARARRRRTERIGGPLSMEANTGLDLPLLEDANAIQIAIQEIMQAILDRRIDAKRAGLLLYSLQLASTNIRNLQPLPFACEPRLGRLGKDDEEVFNDTIAPRDAEIFCDEECEDCAEEDCARRVAPDSTPAPPRKPPKSAGKPTKAKPLPA
jgi:hypothetical protein